MQQLRLLNKYFDGIKNSELKTLALMLGSAQSGTKSELKKGLDEQIVQLNTLRNLRNSKEGLRVMGIDLGIANFACTTFHWNKHMERPMLKDMYKVQLAGEFVDLPSSEKSLPLRPEIMASLGRNLAKWLAQFDSNAYFIERQRSRSASSATILENILKVILLEYVLYSNLQNHIIDKNLQVHLFPSNPRRMVDFTCSEVRLDDLSRVPGSHAKKSQPKPTSSMLSKKIRIALCRSLIHDQISGLPRHFCSFDLDPKFAERCLSYPGDKSTINFYQISRGSALDVDNPHRNKNDDLCDSLLHGFVWLQWVKNLDSLLELTNRSNEVNAKGQEEFKRLIEQFDRSRKAFLKDAVRAI